MCRHLAYLGPPATLASVLIAPPHGLYRQSWAPRRQRHGTVNADGFGAGWYADGDPVPARYRRATPMWGDPSFADVARVTRSGALLAAVRCATAGGAGGEEAAAPFSGGSWLFSHNGAVQDWPLSTAAVAATLPPAELVALEARVDSALIWALVLHRLRGGAGPAEALASVLGLLECEQVKGRFNFLMTDGDVIAATASGDTLCYRRTAGSVTVASEPCDDDAGWIDVPDGSVLLATAEEVSVRPVRDADAAKDPALNGRTAST
jgi:gamma-glutamyl hercynylcysteine S-oxide hydrolase